MRARNEKVFVSLLPAGILIHRWLMTTMKVESVLSRGLLLIIVSGVAAGTMFVASGAASQPPNAPVAAASALNPHSEGLTATGEVRTFSYILSTEGLADDIAASGRASILLYEDTRVELLLDEFSIFLPGQQKVIFMDENFQVIREEPIEARFFRGTTSSGEKAFLTVAPEGLHGVIEHKETQYSLQPLGFALDGRAQQEVAWVERVDDLPSVIDDLFTEQTIQPLEPREDDGIVTIQASHQLYVQPYAEPSYRSYASDYATRISSAYGYVNDMFASETDIDLYLYAVWAGPYNWGGGNTCGVGDFQDAGLTNFREGWVRYNMFTGPNAYSNFHAADGQGGWYGCGYNVQLSNRHTGENLEHASHAIYAADISAWDGYDPDWTAHRGIVVGHELTHNAGEWEHPQDGFCPNVNIMGSGPPDCRNRWRTATTQARVESYAWPRT